MSLLADGKASYRTFAPPPVAPDEHPRVRASWLSRLFMVWCDPLLSLGNEKQLDLSDTWGLEDANACSHAADELEHHWKASGSIVRAFFRCHGRVYVVVGGFLAMAYGCDLLGPVILNQVVTLVAVPDVDMRVISSWLGLLFASRVLKSILFGHVYKETQVLALRFTAGIKCLVFRKSIRLSNDARLLKSTGDITNLYTTDVGNILLAAYYVHELWILPTEIGIALYLLHSILGIATFAGLAVILLVLAVNQVMAKVMASAFERIMTIKDERMQRVHELFGAIQTVKFNAWEPKFEAKITAIRKRELAVVWRYLLVGAFNIFALWGAPMFVSSATFAVYAIDMHQTLTAANVFTALALFRLMQEPLRSFPKIVAGMIQAQISLERLRAFYELPEREANAMAPTAPASDVAIAIDDGSFAWTVEGDAVFERISLRVKQGDFVIVHGKVGSGKSSLCAALLGDLQRRRGSVYIGGSVAYCSQQPWVQNLSVRENIVFGSPYDKKKYLKVLEACGLIPDLQSFAAGDKTEIGQKGLTISGGQMARIALARACYSDADIFILDAPLAAVDALVASDIFQKCLLGLLRHKTRLLVTHNPDFIGSKAVDSVLKLADGRLTHTRTIDKTVLGPPPVSPLLGARVASRRPMDQRLTPAAPFAPVQQLLDDGFGPLGPCTSSFELGNGLLGQEEERPQGRVAGHVFASYFRAMGGVRVSAVVVALLTRAATWLCGFLVLVQCLWQALMQGSDFFLARWTAQDDAEQARRVLDNVLIYTGLALGSSALVLVRTLTVAVCGVAAARSLFAKMTHALVRAPMSFFDATPIGRILNRYSDDVSRVDFQLPFAFGSVLAMGFSVGCTLLTACAVAKYFGLLVMPILALYFRVGLYYLRPARELQRLQKVTLSPVLAHVAEANDGCAVIRAFGPEAVRRFCVDNAAKINDNNRAVYAGIVVGQWFAMRVQLLGGVVVVVLAAALTLLRDELSPGVVGLAFNYGLAVDLGLEGLVQAWAWLETAMVSPERLEEYVDVPPEAAFETDTVAPPPEWPAHGEVVFENVSLRYRPEGPLVLDDVSFRILPGEKVGVVGRTGAGKSSLAKALFRLHEVAAGRVLVDGVDTAELGLRTLRSRLAIVTQAPVIFKGPLRGYLDPFDECTDDDLWRALAKVELHSWASDLPGKLQAPLEENGENLSVGERQMLCMARALLSEAQIVLMDEATAAIDRDTDAKLQRVVRAEFNDATVITIAHRLDTVLDGHRIMVLDAGRVVQFDSPMRLIAKGQGHFYNLAKEGGYLDRVEH
ncbi:multidrug resistance-associated protein 1 [Achlya hypogyna]|uniref:Multidrug resistance-associated protein 1 n=1 Tax=Achlya hypogyna TaxID=1202772 RepID=A0A1V9Z4N8_ACHHY|nr:multidrug resistance-associated protein 1 [Achlya hypogyna]